MLIIPTNPIPSQVLATTLNSQTCTIAIYQRSTGLFMDVSVSNILVIGGVLCLDRTLVVRDAYLGFAGDLFWADMQGTTDPTSTALGTRFLLFYALPTELAPSP
jgi:hypothetical protein